MAQKRIHLVSPGGGAACGAHSLGAPNGIREVLSTGVLDLVDCRKCKTTDRFRRLFDMANQHQLRLFTLIEGKRVINPALDYPQLSELMRGKK